MPKDKLPLQLLVERNKPNSAGGRYGWLEFKAMADLPRDKRPSYWSLRGVYGKSNKTIKVWLDRYDEEMKS